MRTPVALFVFVAFTAAQASAQLIDSFHVFPVVAHTTGAGSPPTYWKSDLVIQNLTGSQISVGFYLCREGQENQFDFTYAVVRQIPANGSLLVEDVLATLFNETGNAKGSLMIDCHPDAFPANPVGTKVVATTRTYNSGDPAGTYGQTIPTSWVFWNGSATPSYAAGARQDSRYRSNLGIVSVAQNAITVHYRIRRADGTIVVQGLKQLTKFSMGQWSFASLGVGMETGPLTVELWLDPADVLPPVCTDTSFPNLFVAYVSKVDGNPDGTGDAEFIYAFPTEFPPVIYDCDERQ